MNTSKIKRSPIRFTVAVLAYIVQLPLMILFYFIRSAWEDCWRVGSWMRPVAICEHGIDRNRAVCDDCNTREEHEVMSMFNLDMDHAHLVCSGCEETFCVKGEWAAMQDGDACPKCHIATVERVAE